MTRWRMTSTALLIIGGMVTAWPAIAAAAEGACGYDTNSNGHQVPHPCGDDPQRPATTGCHGDLPRP